jgi:hypothetical protein
MQQPRFPPSLRLSDAWNADDRFRLERGPLERLVERIPDQAFKRWIRRSVTFDRVSRPRSPRAGVRPGMLIIYDSFWEQTAAGQMNVLTFELAKALWFERINPGPRESRPAREIEFEALFRAHQRTIEAMKFASWGGENLGHLSDQDLQSWFAYACRVAVFDLAPPVPAPGAYSREQWRQIERDWRTTRAAVREFVTKILPGASP